MTLDQPPAVLPCKAFAVAKKFDFAKLFVSLSSHYRCERYRDSTYVEWKSGDVFIFDFGVFITWNVEPQDEEILLEHLKLYAQELYHAPHTDEFAFEENPAEKNLIREDQIHLRTSDYMEKYSISQAIAQSVKLAELEEYAEKTITETSHIPANMAKDGKSRLSRKSVAQMRGHLFMVESNISLHYALLDTPEFFWEYPEYEETYRKIAEYLDVAPRVEILNKKLKIIHDMFDMLADEQKHQHSSLLEWIIIWLIAVEIVIFLVHDLLKLI